MSVPFLFLCVGILTSGEMLRIRYTFTVAEVLGEYWSEVIKIISSSSDYGVLVPSPLQFKVLEVFFNLLPNVCEYFCFLKYFLPVN